MHATQARPTRILILCEYPTLNGGEHSLLSTLPAVREAGFEIRVAAPPEGPLAEILRQQGIPPEPFSSLAEDGNRLSQEARRRQLADLVQRVKPDLIHANSLAMARLAGPVSADSKIPGIGHIRDIVKLSRRAIDDVNHNTRLLAVSQATKAAHVERGLDADRCYVQYNGVDLNRFQPRPATGLLHSELGLPPEALLVGTIGQICLRKGLDVLIRAAEQICRECPHVHLLVVGERWSEKPESRRFEDDLRRAAQSALAGRLHLLGFREDIPALLGELALLLHPARQEPLGRVLLEAAASGLAVVATDVGGTREIFPPEAQSAVLVSPDDPRALAEASIDLLNDDPRRTTTAAAARHRAEDAFSLCQAAEGLVEHYRAVLELQA